MASSSVPLASKPKPKVKLFVQVTKANITQQAPEFGLVFPYLMKTFCACYSLRKYFLTFLKLQLFQ